MKQMKCLAALGLIAASGIANAGISSTITAVNDYDFRGITQTEEKPALQASFDYAHDSGFYVGAWASNVHFPGYNGDVELDGYAGFTGKLGETSSWDAGFVYYSYPGSTDDDGKSKIPNFPEIYASITTGVFKTKFSYSNDFGGSDESAYYIDFTVNAPIGKNFSLQAHGGYSLGDGAIAIAGKEYIDFYGGVGYALGNFNLAVKYTDTNRPGNIDGRVIFSVATTFPWK